METMDTAYGTFSVYINTLISTQGYLYHISFVDKKNKTHILIVHKVSGNMEFVNSETLPEWIISLKNRFELLIAKHRVKNSQPYITFGV